MAFLLVMLTFVLSSCTEEVTLTTMAGKEYEVVSAKMATEYANRIPEAGWTFLLIGIEGAETDLDNMQASFYGPESKAAVTDEVTTAECQLIVYAQGTSGEIEAILLFEVPQDFSDTFQLYGPAFQSVSLNVEKSSRTK